MFTMKIDTGYDAFNDGLNGKLELCRLIDEVKKQIYYGCVKGSCMDINGNKVGEWRIIDNE